MNLISSDVIKGVVDTGTVLMKFLDTGIGKLTVLASVFKTISLAGQAKANEQSLFSYLFDGLAENLDKIQNLDIIQSLLNPFKKGYANVFKETFSGYSESLTSQMLNPKQTAAAIQGFVQQFKGITAEDLFGQIAKSGVDPNLFDEIYNSIDIDADKLASTVLNQEQVDKIMDSLRQEFAKISPVDLLAEVANATGGDTSMFDAIYQALGIDPDDDESIMSRILSPEQISEALEGVEGLTDAQREAIMGSNLFAVSETAAAGATDIFSAAILRARGALIAFKDGLAAAWANHPALLIIAGVTLAVGALIAAYKKWGPTHENALKKLDQETEELKSVQTELKAVDNELNAVQDSMNELLSKDKLTFVEEQELDRLKAVNDELEREKKLLEAKAERERQDQIEAAVDAFNKDPNLRNNNTQANVAAATTTGAATFTPSTTSSPTDGGAYTNFDYKLKALEEANKRFIEAQNALADAEDAKWNDTSPHYQKLVKNVQKAEDEIARLNKDLDDMGSSWQENYGDIGFIYKQDGKELTDLEKNVNDRYRQFKDAMDKQALLNNDITKADVLERIFGKTGTDAAQAFKKEFAGAFRRGATPEEIIEEALNNEDYESLFNHLLNKFNITKTDVASWFSNSGSAVFDRGFVETKTYSALAASAESINEVYKQTQEILTKGTTVTQEYKDSLIAMVGNEEKVNECFVDGNSLVVKNADGLNDLIKISKKNISAQAKLAKTQARLRYSELYDKIKELRKSESELTDATRAQIDAYYDEMSALQSSIAQYTILEQKLLGASSAYERLATAQEIDAANDYGSKAEELMNVLTSAFKSGEVGTEAFKVALEGMIPEEVYADAKNLDEALKNIQKYAKEGDLSTLFTIKYGSDGAIESVEMTKKNVIDTLTKWTNTKLDDGSGTIFTKLANGNFELNPAITNLKELAEETNLTEEVVFAFLTELEKYDLSHLGGDNSSLLEQLMGDDLEYRFHKTTEAMADVEKKLIDGKISLDKYMEEMYGLDYLLQSEVISQDQYNKKLDDLKKKLSEGKISLTEFTRAVYGLDGVQKQNRQSIVDNTVAWGEVNDAVDAARQRLETANKELAALNNQTTPDPAEIKVKTDEVRDASRELADALAKKAEFEEPTELYITTTLDELDSAIAQWQSENADLYVKVKAKLETDDDGKITIPVELAKTLSGKEYEELQQYVDLLNQQHTVNVLADNNSTDSTAELEGAIKLGETLTDTLKNIPNELSIDCSKAQSALDGLLTTATLLSNMSPITVSTNNQSYAATGNSGRVRVNGTAHIGGAAYANGNWGTKRTETALVGELGPELIVDPDNGTWRTVGDNGAEFANIRRGSIIFNHKQTESLLKNGYVSGRGKLHGGGNAFASGNAYAYAIGGSSKDESKLRKELKEDIQKIADQTKSAASDVNDAYNYYLGLSAQNTQLAQTYSTLVDTFDYGGTVDLPDSIMTGSGNGSGSGDAKDEFDEVFDWIEVRIEELTEKISLKEAQLENASNLTDQNKILDEMIDIHQNLYDDLIAGEKEYNRYAATLLEEIPSSYREMAQNGAIAIEEFVGEVDEKTLEAIQKYRDWTQKAADAAQQAEETLTTIRDLTIQQFENARESGDVRVAVEDSKIEKLQNAVDLDEAKGLITSDAYYYAMMENANKKIEYLTEARNNMQKELDDAVASGKVTEGSNEWYELINEMYGVDSEIADARIELEEFQNSINDLRVDRFDEMIERLNDVQEDAQDLIDIMSDDDMFIKPDGKTYEGGTVNFWGAEDVAWTEEGLATMGLFAQQMEVARAVSSEADEALRELNKAFEEGKISEIEYREESNKIKDIKMDAINLDKDARKGIEDLNAARIEHVKKGIEKEIEAYNELIDAKIKSLDADKDAHDWEKSVAEKQKDIDTLERKLAALQYDNSISAAAKRKQLAADLAEARSELEEMYYDRSIDLQKESLEKEKESFQEAKNEEIEQWDTYLENIEQIVTDSLVIIKENADAIGETLVDKTEEYGLAVSDAVLSPWKDGASAISDYQTALNTAASSTTDKLNAIRDSWQEVIDKMDEASNANIANINQENAKYEAASKDAGNSNNSSNAKNSQYDSYTVKSGDTLWDIATAKLGSGARWQEIYNLNKDIISNPDLIQPGWILKLPKYAKGTTGVNNSQLAIIDELGDELLMHADGSGRLAFLSKGSAVIPHDISENLMTLGQLNPQDILERNRPVISAPHVTNNETVINIEYGDVLHIDNYSGDKPENLSKLIDKAFDKHMKELNQQIRRYTR